jgi:hypothetical protein
VSIKKELMKVKLQLRYQILPGSDVEIQAKQLAEFCSAHNIEEVVMFYAAEEWNNGLLSGEDEEMWFQSIKTAKIVLDSAGIITSLNPWMTVLHTDRGRTFPKGSNFQPMVSPLGEESKACVSFACQEWQQSIAKQYERFSELGFRVVWVEDDFRFHNHTPLTWGGGFEQGVIDRFSKAVGQDITREILVQTVLKPGEPHPWRKILMEVWESLQLEVAQFLHDAVVRGSSGKSLLGLMSSAPPTHSAEGRNWKRLFGALEVDSKVVHRPHFAPYSDHPGIFLVYSCMMLDMQKNLRKKSYEVAAEIENFPYTSWIKSDTQTWAEMAFALFHGSDALFVNLFPFSGRPNHNPEIGVMLDRSLPALNWIAGRFSKEFETGGVGALWKENAQQYTRTQSGSSLSELEEADFSGPWNLLIPYGIPVSRNRGEVNALFGTLAWAFTDDELRSLLAGGLLLDGSSAEILLQRGFGEDIGLTTVKCYGREESLYSIEIVVDTESGVEKGHCSNANLSESMYALEPSAGAQVWTEIVTPGRESFGAGVVVYKNVLGGRVVTFAAPNPATLPRHFQRQTIMQNLIRFLYGEGVSVEVSGAPNLMPIYFEGKSAHVVLFNGSPDSTIPKVRINGIMLTPSMVNATLLKPLTEPITVDVEINTINEVTTISLCKLLPYMGFIVLSWEQG